MNFKKLSVLILALGCAHASHAATESMSQRSEARFLDIAGTKAVTVAPHLYRVEKNGAVHMYAFGRDAVEMLNATVAGSVHASDAAAAERFSDNVSAAMSNADKAYDGRTVALCAGGTIADVSASTSPAFAYHSARADAVLTHNQVTKGSYLGSVYTEALACLPLNSGGESCVAPYGDSANDGRSGTLTVSNPQISAHAAATTQWPSFSFSKLHAYALATCGFWDAAAAYVCHGDGYFNTCP